MEATPDRVEEGPEHILEHGPLAGDDQNLGRHSGDKLVVGAKSLKFVALDRDTGKIVTGPRFLVGQPVG